jgi:hypothetical protein
MNDNEEKSFGENTNRDKEKKDIIDSEYIDTQLSMISKVISNTIRYFTSQEVKNNIDSFEYFINEMGLENDKLTPAIKETIQNIIKFLTTEQIKRLISYIESKPDEDLEKTIREFMTYNYRVMKRTYNGFLEFMVTKMSSQQPRVPEEPKDTEIIKTNQSNTTNDEEQKD